MKYNSKSIKMRKLIIVVLLSFIMLGCTQPINKDNVVEITESLPQYVVTESEGFENTNVTLQTDYPSATSGIFKLKSDIGHCEVSISGDGGYIYIAAVFLGEFDVDFTPYIPGNYILWVKINNKPVKKYNVTKNRR